MMVARLRAKASDSCTSSPPVLGSLKSGALSPTAIMAPASVGRPGSGAEGSGLDAGRGQCLPDGPRGAWGARRVPMEADGVALARAGQSQRLLGRLARLQHRSRLGAGSQASVRKVGAIGEGLAVAWHAQLLTGGEEPETGLAHDADLEVAGDSRHPLRSLKVRLAVVIEGAVRLDIAQPGHRGEGADPEAHTSLKLIERQLHLQPPEVLAVVVSGMRADLDPQLAAAPHRQDAFPGRPGVGPAADVGAVDDGQDLLVVTGPFAHVRVQVHRCSVSPLSSRMACPSTGRTASSDSLAPFTLPGRLTISVLPRTPGSGEERAASGVLAKPAERISSPRPGTSYSPTPRVASGVTSRGPRPVPPVVTTRSCSSEPSTRNAAMPLASSGTTPMRLTSKPAAASSSRPAGPLSSAIRPAAARSLTVSTTALKRESSCPTFRRSWPAGGPIPGRRPSPPP